MKVLVRFDNYFTSGYTSVKLASSPIMRTLTDKDTTMKADSLFQRSARFNWKLPWCSFRLCSRSSEHVDRGKKSTWENNGSSATKGRLPSSELESRSVNLKSMSTFAVCNFYHAELSKRQIQVIEQQVASRHYSNLKTVVLHSRKLGFMLRDTEFYWGLSCISSQTCPLLPQALGLW